MSRSKSARSSPLFFMVGLMALLTFGYQYGLYPLLLKPVGERYTLDNLIWEQGNSLDCQQQTCRLQGNAQPVSAIAWLPSQDAGHFVLDYSLKINSNNKAHPDLLPRARIAFYPENNGRLSWDMFHEFFKAWRPGTWDSSSLLHFKPPVDRFKLAIELRDPYGSFTIERLVLQEFQETLVQHVILTILIVLWVLLAIYAFYWLGNGQWTKNWPLLLVYLIIVFGTQVPNSWFSSIRYILDHPAKVQDNASKSVVEKEQASKHSRTYTAKGAVRLSWVKKVGHLLLFATLIILLRSRLPWQTIWLLIPAALLALATEAAQGLGYSRSPSLADWGINMSGAILGLLIVSFWLRMRKGGPVN